MTGGRTPEEQQVLGLSGDVDPTVTDVERTRRTVEALERLRDQLLDTQGALDEYLGRLDSNADDAHATTGG